MQCALKKSRSFEYLAATDAMGSTPIPGPESFTSALIYALEALIKEKEGGRFTTVEVLNKITHHAPYFPKDQFPVLTNREDGSSRGVRIMLSPLHKNGSDIIGEHKIGRHRLKVPGTTGAASFDQSTLTLHLDFREKPSSVTVASLGRVLNKAFTSDVQGLHRVRWGGIRPSMATRGARTFQTRSQRIRRDGVPSIVDKSEDGDNMAAISGASTKFEGSPDRSGNYPYRRVNLDSESRYGEYRDNSTQTYQSEYQPGTLVYQLIERKKALKALNIPIHRLYLWLHTSSMCLRVFNIWTRYQEPPLDEGKVRVRWTCQCGKKLWDDFVELRAGAAEDLRKSLERFENNVLRRPQGSAIAQGTSAIQEPPTVYLPASSPNWATSTGMSTTLGSSEFSSSAVTVAGDTSSSTPGSLQNLDNKFLLLCLSKTNDTLRVSQHPVQQITNDFQLFRMLQDVYADYRGVFARLFSPRKIVSLNFTKVGSFPS